MTLVFVAGACSQAILQKLEARKEHYVSAIRPYYQQALLAEAAAHLEEVTLSSGAVRAWRTKGVIAGQPRDALVVFSPQLYAGQPRGLYQHLVRLLGWCARRDVGFAGSARILLAQLARIRRCRIVEHSGRPGRPRLRQQMNEMDSNLKNLGRALRALPTLS